MYIACLRTTDKTIQIQFSPMLPTHLLKTRHALGAFFALAFFALYSYTAARYNVGYGDADEMIVTGHLLSVPHPSGYPLIVILVKLFTILPIPGSIAFKANLLSSFLHAGTLLLLFYIAFRLLDEIFPSTLSKAKSSTPVLPENHRRAVALLGTSILGLSTLFWMYAGIIEVFALNSFILAATLLSALQWRHHSLATPTLTSSHLKWFFLTVLLTGIGLAHLQTYVLVLPGLGILWWISLTKPQRLQYLRPVILMPALLLLGLSWLLPNLLLFWLNGNQQYFSWFFEQNRLGWWRMITRQDYTGFIPEKQLQVAAYFAGINPAKFMSSMLSYIGIVFSQFTFLGIATAFLGFLLLWKYKRSLAITFGLLYIISGPLFGGRVGVPEDKPQNIEYRMEFGISQRQYLQGYVILGILLSIGLAYIITHKRIPSSYRTYTTYSLGAVTLIWLFIGNWPVANQRANQEINQYGRVLLDSAEANSVIVCFSDLACFSLFYLQLVEGYRTDVTILIKNPNYRRYFLDDNPQYQGYRYGANPFFTADIIAWNASQRTTYLTEPTGYYIDYIGLEGDAYFLIPQGYLYKIVKQIPESVPAVPTEFTQKYLEHLPSSKDYWRSGFSDYLANNHTITGIIYSKLGDKATAQQHFSLAIRLSPRYPLPQAYLPQLANYAGDPNYAYGKTAKTSTELLEQGLTLIKQNQLDSAYKLLRKASFADPRAIEPHWQLAQLYLRGNFPDQYRQELEYILRYHPDYQAAKDALPN